jgi:hypothetical protein
MTRWRALSRTQRLAAFALITGALAGGVGMAVASDHQDTPLVELNPQSDMTDVYAFPGSAPGRIVLVMNTYGFLSPANTPTASFNKNLLYQLKIDNDGDSKEDRVIQFTFSGSGTTQKVKVFGPIAPPVQGAMLNTVSTGSAALTGTINTTIGSATGIQVFAGTRDDPFFLDLEQFLRIIPDRKPVTGPNSLIPDVQSATAWRSPATAVNYIAGYNVLSIIIELPSSMLENGAPGKLGIWGTVSS